MWFLAAGMVALTRPMPHRRRTSSTRSISRGRSGRKLGTSTVKIVPSPSPSRVTLQPRRVSAVSQKSASMGAPQSACTRARRSETTGCSLGAGYRST